MKNISYLPSRISCPLCPFPPSARSENPCKYNFNGCDVFRCDEFRRATSDKNSWSGTIRLDLL